MHARRTVEGAPRVIDLKQDETSNDLVQAALCACDKRPRDTGHLVHAAAQTGWRP